MQGQAVIVRISKNQHKPGCGEEFTHCILFSVVLLEIQREKNNPVGLFIMMLTALFGHILSGNFFPWKGSKGQALGV